MVVIRAGNDDGIPFAVRVFFYPCRDRSVKGVIQIFDDDPDAFVLGAVL